MDKSRLFTRINQQSHFIPQDTGEDEVEEITADTCNAPLSEVVQLIADQFYLKKGWAGSIKNGKFNHLFEKAATNCKKLNANPIYYVDAHFVNKNPDEVFIPFLTAKNSDDLYKTYIEAYLPNYQELFEVYMHTLKRQLQLGRTVEWTLLNPHLTFASWFRVCITNEEIPEVSKVYKRMAVKERTPELIEFLRDKGLDYGRIHHE